MIKWLLILFLGSMIAVEVHLTDTYEFEIPEGWPKPAYDFALHPLDSNKVLLGRLLFYDPILSRDSMVSCASCHSPYTAFAHVDHQLSHGIADRIGKRNAPALMNLAWSKNFMWDGAVRDIDKQALIPIAHPDEMGSEIPKVITKLQSSLKYRLLFQQAFGENVITADRMSEALSQFVLQLTTSNSKYDSVMRKQAYFSEQEQKGYRLFRSQCASCHKEPIFTNNNFRNNGLQLNEKLNDSGRIKITGKATDFMSFKVPTLRNIAFTSPYMHDGRFLKLSEVLKHYMKLKGNEKGLASELRRGVNLTTDEASDLIAFLFTLSDKSFVFNPKYGFPLSKY